MWRVGALMGARCEWDDGGWFVSRTMSRRCRSTLYALEIGQGCCYEFAHYTNEGTMAHGVSVALPTCCRWDGLTIGEKCQIALGG